LEYFNKKDYFQNFEHIICWSTVLLDTHFTQFILVDELTEILSELNQAVEKQVQIFESLQFFSGIAAQLEKKVPQTSFPSYHFEEVKFYQ